MDEGDDAFRVIRPTKAQQPFADYIQSGTAAADAVLPTDLPGQLLLNFLEVTQGSAA